MYLEASLSMSAGRRLSCAALTSPEPNFPAHRVVRPAAPAGAFLEVNPRTRRTPFLHCGNGVRRVLGLTSKNAPAGAAGRTTLCAGKFGSGDVNAAQDSRLPADIDKLASRYMEAARRSRGAVLD